MPIVVKPRSFCTKWIRKRRWYKKSYHQDSPFLCFSIFLFVPFALLSNECRALAALLPSIHCSSISFASVFMIVQAAVFSGFWQFRSGIIDDRRRLLQDLPFKIITLVSDEINAHENLLFDLAETKYYITISTEKLGICESLECC